MVPTIWPMCQHHHSTDALIHLLEETSQKSDRANTKLNKINKKPKRIREDEAESRHLENQKGQRKENIRITRDRRGSST